MCVGVCRKTPGLLLCTKQYVGLSTCCSHVRRLTSSRSWNHPGGRLCCAVALESESHCGDLQVQMVLEWTSAVGVNLLAGVPGPQGLTALHVAAVMEDGASLAALLTGQPAAWLVQCSVPSCSSELSTPTSPHTSPSAVLSCKNRDNQKLSSPNKERLQPL